MSDGTFSDVATILFWVLVLMTSTVLCKFPRQKKCDIRDKKASKWEESEIWRRLRENAIGSTETPTYLFSLTIYHYGSPLQPLYQLNVFYKLCITKTRLFKYIENFTTKKKKKKKKKKPESFQLKILIFFIFLLKRILWVLVRITLPRRFYRVPTIYVLSRNKKNNVYPCKPQFYYIYIKVEFKGFNII